MIPLQVYSQNTSNAMSGEEGVEAIQLILSTQQHGKS